MAMFDIGKRGAGSSESQEEDFMREFDTPVAGVIPEPVGGGVRRRDAAVIGPSIHIEGTLRGEEDLIIEGHVSGTVQLQENCLTIGTHGQVNADIYAHTIFVEGTVEGDLYGSERVAIKKTAEIRGNVTSPRVSLEDGAKFKGAIEMDKQAVEAVMGVRKSSPAAKPVSASPSSSTPSGTAAKSTTTSGSTSASVSDSSKASNTGGSSSGSAG